MHDSRRSQHGVHARFAQPPGHKREQTHRISQILLSDTLSVNHSASARGKNGGAKTKARTAQHFNHSILRASRELGDIFSDGARFLPIISMAERRMHERLVLDVDRDQPCLL